MSASSIKAAFAGASARRYDEPDVPLIGKVRIQSLTAREVRSWRESLTDERGKPTPRLERANELLVALAVVDEAGNRVFSDDDAMSMLFDELDSAAFSALAKLVRKHTNVDADPDWRAIEDAGKNSGATG